MNAKRALIEPGAEMLSLRRQCVLLGLNRSSWYAPAPVGGESEENLRLMHRIDELYTACPFYGSHKLTMVLRREGHGVNRKRVRRLMRRVGLESIVLKPQLSRPRRVFARADDRTHQSGRARRGRRVFRNEPRSRSSNQRIYVRS